jgi:hypothetical protein
MASKVQERIYAEKAIALLAVDWTLQDIPEPLDFEIRTEKFRFGLEVRNVFAGGEETYGSPRRRNESINSRLICSLAQQYYAGGGRPIAAQFLDKVSDVKAEQVAQIVKASALLQPREQTTLHIDKMKVFLTALPSSVGRYFRWTVVSDHVGWARKVTREELQAAINRKKKHLSRYTAKYAEIDLLLVADRILNSGRLLQEIVVSNPGFRSIYFLSYPEAIHRVG